jgi:hypothetical protein
MAETLEAVRDRLRRQYVGKAGIQGIGLNRADGTIRLFVQDPANPERAALLKQISADAAPYPVCIVDAPPPSATFRMNT